VQLQVSGKVSTQQWSAAVRVLALRGNIKTLHILAAAPTSPMQASSDASRMNIPGAATLPTLLPLRQLLPDLRALTITGVSVTNMSEGLPGLLAPPDPYPAVPTPAAAVSPGFKHLEALNLSCSWSPTGSVSNTAGFTAAMQLLPQKFPNLTHLTLQLPAIAVPVVRYVAPHAAPAAAGAAAGGPAALLAAAVNARAATATAQHFQMQSTLLSAAAAAAAALPKLQQLDLARVPDLWAGPGPEASLVTAGPILTAAAAAAGLPGAALRSLEGLGGWLLQQRPDLAQLNVNTVGGTCSMTWTRPAAHASSSSSSNAAGTAAAAVPSIKLTYRASTPAPRAAAAAAAAAAAGEAGAATTAAGTNSSSSRSDPPQLLLSQISEHLARYTSRPAAEALSNITSLQLAIHPDQLRSAAAAAAALAAMPALRHLKLTVLATSSRPTNFAALVATAAAAGGGQLESLTLLPGLGRVEVTAEALLPLTAAAGGPGSSLKELRLIGTFSATSSSSSSSCGQGLGSPWAVLRELQGLEALRVHQLGPAVLELPLECLPAQLRRFDARRVHLLGPVTHGGSTAAADDQDSTAGSSCSVGAPFLTSLQLQDCTVDSVAGLASSRLQQLSIAATELPGGWLAAVAAWPELQHLTFWCSTAMKCLNGSSSSSSSSSRKTRSSGGRNSSTGHGSSKGAAPAAAAATASAAEESSVRLLQELTGFKHLQGLVLQHLGHLNPEVLSQAVHHMPSLTHLEVTAAAVSQDFLQTPLLPATVAGSSSSSSSSGTRSSSSCGTSSSSLKFVALRLPALLPAAVTGQKPENSNGSSSSSDAGAGVAGLVVASQGSGVPAAAAAAAAAAVNAAGTGVAAAVSQGIPIHMRRAVVPVCGEAVQGKLLEALPWCTVSVTADVCIPYVSC